MPRLPRNVGPTTVLQVFRNSMTDGPTLAKNHPLIDQYDSTFDSNTHPTIPWRVAMSNIQLPIRRLLPFLWFCLGGGVEWEELTALNRFFPTPPISILSRSRLQNPPSLIQQQDQVWRFKKNPLLALLAPSPCSPRSH